jgi:hypothetical protein
MRVAIGSSRAPREVQHDVDATAIQAVLEVRHSPLQEISNRQAVQEGANVAPRT